VDGLGRRKRSARCVESGEDGDGAWGGEVDVDRGQPCVYGLEPEGPAAKALGGDLDT
jgi:hypothetical protein